MCKNHHWEYDHDLLDDKDYIQLIKIIITKGEPFLTKYSNLIVGKSEIEQNKRYTFNQIKLTHSINQWIMKHRQKLDRLGFLVDNK